MQDRPTAVELLRAAQEFCERDLGPNLTGRLRFHVRVLQNVLGILEREWDGEESALTSEWARLNNLLGEDDQRPTTLKGLTEQVRAWNVRLATKIRAGEFDERSDDVLAALYETVSEKLAIANPNYASSATSTGASARSTR